MRKEWHPCCRVYTVYREKNKLRCLISPGSEKFGENGTDRHLPDWISYLPLGSQAVLVVIHWVHNGCDLFEVPLRAAGISETKLTHQV